MRRSVRVGLAVESEVPGTVPIYEALEAAIYCGYTVSGWWDVDWLERARAVAQYRMHNLIESHVQNAINRETERKSAQRGRNRG